MRIDHGLGARHKLVVHRRVSNREIKGKLGARAGIALEGAGGGRGAAAGKAAVDLVKGEPIFDLAVIAVEDAARIATKMLDARATLPAIHPLDKRIGHLVVADSHKRLDAMGEQAVEDAIVKSQARLVGLLLHPRGKDARPGDGHAEGLESHLGHKGDIALVGMVEVDALVVGVVLARRERGVDHARRADVAAGHHVGNRGTFAVNVPSALKLVGGRSATPQKTIGKY